MKKGRTYLINSGTCQLPSAFRAYITGMLSVVLLIAALLPTSTVAQTKTATLNLADTDITTLIGTIADLTGKNFIIDPRVKGKVTVISSRPMQSEELYQVFLSILQVHGYTAVESGDVIKILPDVNARQQAIPAVTSKNPGQGDELVTRVITIQNVGSAQLVPILRPLLAQQSHLAAYPPTNVLVITDRASNIQRIVEIIKRIDKKSGDEIEVIELRHASATEIVRVISRLNQAASQKAPKTGAPKFIADERTNSVLITGNLRARLKIRAIIAHLDTPQESGGNTKVIYLRYAKATDMVKVLTGISGSLETKDKRAAGPLNTKALIQADEATNALIISASPDITRTLRSVVRKLDIRRAQVMVEAVIAEVAIDTTKELGIQWLIDGSPGGNGPAGLINFNSTGSGMAQTIAGVDAGIPQLGDGMTLGLGRFDSADLNFAALIRALTGEATTNLLSTPNLTVLDNEEAEIVVGQNVPFLTGSYSSTGSGSTPSNPFQTIQRQDIGITLKIKPQINEGDAIKLDIQQEVSSISSSALGATDIVTNKRSIKTSILVRDGEMIALGGLMDDSVIESEQKVPGLGDIPGLGWLFRYSSATKVKRNLMIFLRPRIIRDSATQQLVTHSKYNFMRDQQLDSIQRGATLLDGSQLPLLPKLDDPPLPAPFSPDNRPVKPASG